MGNKIKHLLEGFKYQEIATIYCILKYINEKDLEIYIEKQNEEDAQIILDKNHIIDLQFKNKIGKQITIEEFCKWLLTDFRYENSTVMMAPGEGFYETEGLGKQEVRLSFCVGEEDIEKAMKVLEEALKVYNKR